MAALYKFALLGTCIKYVVKAAQSRILLLFLTIFVLGALADDISFLSGLFWYHIMAFKHIDIPLHTLICRINCIVFLSMYQAIALFFEYLIEKKLNLSLLHWYTLLMNIILTSATLYLAIFKFGIPSDSPETLAFELGIVHTAYFILPLMFVPLIIKLYKKIHTIPLILNHQLKSLGYFFIGYALMEAANNRALILIKTFPSLLYLKYPIHVLCALLCSYFLYHTAKKVTRLRFLNIKKEVVSQERFNFLTQFKDILEQLNFATALKELPHITQTFFQNAFGINRGQIRLIIRNTVSEDDYYNGSDFSSKIESFIRHENQPLTASLKTQKIFIRDEIHFTNFYEADSTTREILGFLDVINADLFLPIYERGSIIAYITVDRHARSHKLFTNKERDEMVLFTSYLGNMISLLKHGNIDALRQHQKELSEELYRKHQELQQCKESIRSFSSSTKQRQIGIVFYKNRKFTLANEAAQELLGVDINKEEGHSLTQAFKSLVRRVQDFKSAQSSYVRNNQGIRMVISALPGSDENNVMFLVYYPEIADVLRTQIDQLSDPSRWDYALYLETTKSGQLINQLIPGNGRTLLDFKISLLAAALQKKATLLCMPEEDVLPAVELLHDISMRSSLHTLKLSYPEQNDEVGIKLFGINPIMLKEHAVPLLEKLDTVGTLFIENCEYLSLETQKQLAQAIASGFFYKLKSDQKIVSNVRIICSTTKDLARLVQSGVFSKELYEQLERASLKMPSLEELSESEIDTLAQGYADQIVRTPTYKNLLALTEKDKRSLLSDRPLSLHEFKERVHDLLTEKSTKHNIPAVTELDPAYNVSDPDIAHAVRLGRKALKDPHVMSILWNEFKNQNKIATLLGVNRSSVNRRCHEYNLI